MELSGLRTMCIALLAATIGVTAVHPVSAEEPTKDLLAAQIRDQGFPCSKPVSAQRDLALSKPDEAVWVLKCENGAYRIRLVPDMAARVKRLD